MQRDAPYLYVKSTEASPASVLMTKFPTHYDLAKSVAAIGNNVNVIMDTFDDADRGYFTRTGR